MNPPHSRQPPRRAPRGPWPAVSLAASAESCHLPAPLRLEEGGLVWFLPNFLPPAEAEACFEHLLREVDWRQQPGLFGRPQPRLSAVCGDPGVTYTYSRRSYVAAGWLPQVAKLRGRIEALGGRFNYCLLNRYRSGRDGVGWHADDEPGLAPEIGSLSLGATRTFRLRHNRSRRVLSWELERGSLLLMGGTLQHHWQHTLVRTNHPVGERINLTFRHVEPPR